MWKLANLILIPLLVLCPLLCGAVETDRDAHFHQTWGHQTWGNSSPDASTPDRVPGGDCCPEDGGNLPDDDHHCVCNGAVQSEGPRAPGGDLLCLPGLVEGLFLSNQLALDSHFARLTRAGPPTGWASWGNASRVRAVLQNFRC